MLLSHIFLPISFNICFGAQKNRLIETVLLSTYSQHMFWLSNKKNNYLCYINITRAFC